MRHVPTAALFCAALALAAGAVAQTGPGDDSPSEIVVTGNPDLEGEVRDFVGALTVAPSGQLSRFERSICPAALGVSPAQKEAVVARIRRVAQAANIAVGKPNCTPNVLLVVTDDKALFLEAMLKKHADYFGEMSPKDVRKLGRAPGPAVAWHVQGPKLTGDGLEVAEGEVDEAAVNRTTRVGSRIAAAARPQFGAAAVVVEAKALDGLTTIQLADYAAMRAFSKADPSKLPGTAPTILKVLETPMGEEVPITMTPWDLAFLKSLYQAPANLSAAAQRASISRGIAKQLGKEEGEETKR